jgi:hypothetical protein
VALAVAAKNALDSHDDTSWVAIMLGPKVEPMVTDGSLPLDEGAGRISGRDY